MTERYDYLHAIKADVREYIRNEIEFSDYESESELEEHLNDVLWVDDSVTGNASGSYYCNSWKAEEAIAHNLDLLAEALEEFGCDDVNILSRGAEWCDVAIRCYLLGQAISEVISELDYDFEEE